MLLMWGSNFVRFNKGAKIMVNVAMIDFESVEKTKRCGRREQSVKK